MFEQQLLDYIKIHPEIKKVTNRGLETEDNKVIFIGKNLLDRYPKLEKYFKMKNKEKIKKNKPSE